MNALRIFRHALPLFLLAALTGACSLALEGSSGLAAKPAALSTPIPGATASPPPMGTPDRVGTLPVPTALPESAEAQPTPRPTVSALQRIREEGTLRVGVFYNTAPMSSLNERGRVVGYEADLARAIAEDWGVEVAFEQVTRQTAIPVLLEGQVDILLASMVHRREDEALLGFSLTYYPGGQVFLVRADDDLEHSNALEGQRVGVVQGTASEHALGRALSAGRLNVTPGLYLTLDQAVGALGAGEVRAVLTDRVHAWQVETEVSDVRTLADMLEPEPYAIAFRRHDNALRYLLNRSLQRLYQNDRLAEMRRTWFPSMTFELEMPVWGGLEDDRRTLADFETTLVYPEASIVSRIQAGQALRVAGLSLSPQLSGLAARLEGFYQALVQEMAARWGVPVEYIPDSTANAVELVASAQAELAVGVAPGWAGPYEVGYSAPVIAHGKRLMIPAGSQIGGFADLRGGRWVGIFASEPGAADQVNELAESVNAFVNIFTIINDEDAVYSMVVDQNADVVFGDSLRLLPLVEANAELVTLTDRWYSREYIALAVPRVDPDFWALVDITLQDMAADGTFERLWEETLATGDPITIEQWPGPRGQFLGVRTGAVGE